MEGKIITCHYAYNYGAVLQTYALCSYLNMQGLKTEVINYRPYYYRGSTKSTNKLKLLIRKMIRVPDNIKSEKIFYGFLKEYVPMTIEYKDYDSLKNANMTADVFVAGSDQIWNFNLPNGTDLAFYLDFVHNSGKKISYAASLSSGKLNESQKMFLNKQLQDFDRISVREDTGRELLQSCGIKDVNVVMDPVYLLDLEKWTDMVKCPPYKPKGKYILVYAFNRQKHIFQAAKKLAVEMGYKVYSVNTFWEDVLQGMDHYYWNCKPEEFLYLIKNAECIVTNSFHGLSFSLLFNKPVILYEKDDVGNSRMLDLLNSLDIKEDVLATRGSKILIKKLPYDKINSRINELRLNSKQYLSECIESL